jgi:hypothetical protein
MSQDCTPFEKLLVSLGQAEIAFITVGGVACSLSGFVRTTEDVDILIKRDTDNITRLLETLSSFGQGAARELSPVDFSDEEGAIRIIEDFPLDLFIRMGGRHYEDLLPYARQIEVDGVKIPFLGPEGLILLKQDSMREKDRIDVLALRRLID